MPAVVAGIDSSTQSTKVEVRDAGSGRLLGTGRAPHPPTTPPCSEQDPEAWWAALVDAMASALATARTEAGVRPADVTAVAVAGQQHGMVALDADRRVLHPAKLWNDTESAPDAAWLIGQLPGGAAAWAAACGSVPVAAFTVTKLSWLHRTRPEQWGALDAVALPHDWLTLRLTGRLVTDRGDASGTGYWSPAEGTYRTDLLAIVDADRDWSAALPEVLGPHDEAGALLPEAAEALGLPPGIRVAAGTGDNMAAALGLGLAPGDVAVSIGTSGTVYTLSDTPTADPSGAVAGFADASGRFLPLVCTSNATKVTDTVAGWLGVGVGELDALALGAAPGAGGVVLLPYLDGERTPDRPTATGRLHGLRTATTRHDLARAAFEGVVCGLLDGLDALRAAGVPTAAGRLLLVGGGARSRTYPQVLADLTGRAVTVADGAEYVAAGACVQATAMLEGADPLTVARRWGIGPSAAVEPGPGTEAAGALRTAYAAVRDLDGATAPPA